MLGPIKNKPLRLADGTLISPSSTESPDRPSTWRVHFERSDRCRSNMDDSDARAVGLPGSAIEAIQPSLLVHPRGRLQAVGRTSIAANLPDLV